MRASDAVRGLIEYIEALEARVAALEARLSEVPARPAPPAAPAAPVAGWSMVEAAGRALGRVVTPDEEASLQTMLAQHGQAAMQAVLGRCRPATVRGLGYVRQALRTEATRPQPAAAPIVVAVSGGVPSRTASQVTRERIDAGMAEAEQLRVAHAWIDGLDEASRTALEDEARAYVVAMVGERHVLRGMVLSRMITMAHERMAVRA